MAEYIDREALLKHKRKMSGADFGGDFWDEAVLVEDILNEQTADVVEVRHGKWCKTEQPLGWREVECMECSACKEDCIIDEDFSFEEVSEFWEYCPYCGAKMDGKGEDNGNL